MCMKVYIFWRACREKKRVPLAIGFSFLFSSCVLLPSTGGGFQIIVKAIATIEVNNSLKHIPKYKFPYSPII